MHKDQPSKFSGLTILLHWVVGITIIILLGVGWAIHEFDLKFLLPTHKSIGILIFVVVIVRVIWRAMNGWPTPVGNYSKIEHLLAKIVHWVLLIGTILMPLSGMMMSGAGGHGLAVFGWELLAANPSAVDPSKMIPLNEAAAGFGHEVHEILGSVMMAAVGLHIIGAVKHHVIDKDGTLRRILGKAV